MFTTLVLRGEQDANLHRRAIRQGLMLPAELQSLIDQIDECERTAERLLADMDDDRVNQPPPYGGWSVAQCLDHLAVINEFYLRGWQEPCRSGPRGAWALCRARSDVRRPLVCAIARAAGKDEDQGDSRRAPWRTVYARG